MKPKPKKQSESRAIKELINIFHLLKTNHMAHLVRIEELEKRMALKEGSSGSTCTPWMVDAYAVANPCPPPRKPYINADGSTDWSKVPVDTKVIVSGDSRRYFSHFEHHSVYTFDGGSTSWSEGYYPRTTQWRKDKVKLADE